MWEAETDDWLTVVIGYGMLSCVDYLLLVVLSSTPGCGPLFNYDGQVVDVHVPLSSSSVVWYDDAPWLER